MSRAERWAMRAGILLAFVVVLCSSCRGQAAGTTTGGMTYAEMANNRGFTFCDGVTPISYIRTPLSHLDSVTTQVHEARHRANALRFPNCAAWNAWYNATPRHTIIEEADAFHASWCAAVAAGANAESFRGMYLEFIWKYYRGVHARSDSVFTRRQFDSHGGCR